MNLLLLIAASAVLSNSVPDSEAPAFKCRDDIMPGALVRCRTAPNAVATWNGTRLMVSGAGDFVFGVGWKDEEGTLRVETVNPDTMQRQLSELPVTFSPRTYKTEVVNGLPPKTVEMPESWKKRRAEESGRVRKGRAGRASDVHWNVDFERPADGRISGVYGSHRILNGKPRSPHYGLDIANNTGTPIVAPAGGTVTLAAPDFLLEGGIVIIDHGHGVTSTLFHMHSVDVKEGQQIRQGDRIGTIGAKGRASGPHVDWRVNWRNVRLDPALLLDK